MKTKAILGATALAIAAAGATSADARTQIRIVGSSTVFPFTTAVAENFKRSNPQFQPPIVESTGTGGGVKLFCAGIGAQHPDIVNASRRMTLAEFNTCKANGVTQVVEIKIGIDGLVMAESKAGAPLGLTVRDVYAALAANPFGGTQKARTWKDVNSALPANKIEVIGPPPTSGTRDAFNELYMIAGCMTNPSMVALRRSDRARFDTVCQKIREDGAFILGGENDNLIVQKLVANPNAVGVFGYSYLEENLDKLRDVKINGVEANYNTISTFKYPASRPLYIYVKAQHVRAVRGMREFIAEYTKDTTWGPRGYLVRRGLVASPDATRAEFAQKAAALTPLADGDIK
ncbi:substrate-binding domain-containing protein [Sandaracinobacteroides saxicola]|uniref:Substrate-binding domain-containing protein n=1 Tax=Sandaracinobacteroides saxicola TaxID=2759707 RepID=A0A7G5IMR5_9SPHN|nr:substrate-binding domain-containing protein [Sandaracinobacteroides saxicola]